MLVQLIVLIEGTCLAWGSQTSSHGPYSLWWSDQVDADAQPWLCRVHFHLSVALVLLSLRLNLVNSLLQEDLKLCFRAQFFIVL